MIFRARRLHVLDRKRYGPDICYSREKEELSDGLGFSFARLIGFSSFAIRNFIPFVL